MNPQRTLFLQDLQLPPELNDEACSRSISELISLAAREEPHSISIKAIYQAVLQYDCAVYIEPLDVLPTLLSCYHDGSMDLIRICALNNSPKEIMMVVQETIEELQSRLTSEDENSGPNLVLGTIGVVSLCSPAISRSRVGKRSALDLCSPVLENVASLISSTSSLATKEEGRVLITEAARLVRSLSTWASTVADPSGLQQIKSLLHELLDTTVVGCAPSIQVSLAVRAAERSLPRFFVKTSAKQEWRDGEAAMREVQLSLESLGNLSQTCSSFSDLVYLAHSTSPMNLSSSVSSDLHHLLVTALQMNVVIDEALFLLLGILTQENMSMSLDVVTSLCTVFTALASTHLDPTIRQLNLRLLSLALTKLPPSPRLDILLGLTTDENFPQVRGPAVGLVKEAVLEALALPLNQAAPNPFASPELLRIFGNVLFKPDPPGFFNERKTREELAQSLELLRIVDCLSFYYVLLQRDRDNRTGVRSRGNVTGVRSSMLRPLRQFLGEHINGEHSLMVMLSLQVGLDRIDDALRMLDLES